MASSISAIALAGPAAGREDHGAVELGGQGQDLGPLDRGGVEQQAPGGPGGRGDARRQHRHVRGVDRDGDPRRRLGGDHEPCDRLGAARRLRGDLVRIQVQPVGAGRFLAGGEGLDVPGRGGRVLAALEAPADGALDVLDLAGREVARGDQVGVDRQDERLPVGRREPDPHRSIGQLDGMLAGPLQHPRRVDVLPDDLERRAGAIELHEWISFFSAADASPPEASPARAAAARP
jgi:hypothetical protein